MFRILNDCYFINENNEEKLFKKIKGNTLKSASIENNRLKLRNSELRIRKITKDIEFLNQGTFYLVEVGDKFISIQSINETISFPIKNENNEIVKINIRDLKRGQKILMLNEENLVSLKEQEITNIFQFPLSKFSLDRDSNKMKEYVFLNSEVIINDFILL